MSESGPRPSWRAVDHALAEAHVRPIDENRVAAILALYVAKNGTEAKLARLVEAAIGAEKFIVSCGFSERTDPGGATLRALRTALAATKEQP